MHEEVCKLTNNDVLNVTSERKVVGGGRGSVALPRVKKLLKLTFSASAYLFMCFEFVLFHKQTI